MEFMKRAKMILKKVIKRSPKNELALTNDTKENLFLDLGNANIKALSDDKEIIFRSCSRKVTLDEVGVAPNYVRVDGEYYLIGEPKTALNLCDRKIERNDIKELLGYSIKKLGLKGEINIYMLLPKDQLKDFEIFKKKFNGKLLVEKELVDINFIRAYAEGETAIISESKNHKVIIDIGGGTTDIVEYDSLNNKIDQLTVNMGMRDIEPFYCSLGFQNVETVNKNISNGYKFTKKELERKKQIDVDQVGKIIRTSAPILKNIVRGKTEIYIIGGGALALEDSIKECIGILVPANWYKLVKVKNPLYANITGLRNIILSNN